MDCYLEDLAAIRDGGLYRTLRALPSVGGRFEWDGRTVLNFSSNDYLDLARAPELRAAAHAAIEEYGCGATSSRLMAGHTELHERLEGALASWVGAEAALVFGTGFQANLGVLTALTTPDDMVFSDRLNHASLIDGCRLSKAAVHRFGHNDLDHLESLLRAHVTHGRRVIVSETLFSMDGDRAPVRGLRELADRHDALLVLDEAHALGVFGPHGSGICRNEGVTPDVLVGTLGKSLGSFGGFVAAQRPIVEMLVNRARSFIYSTGLPPASAASALAAIELVHAQPNLGRQLVDNADGFTRRLRACGVEVSGEGSQILPIILNENEVVMQVAQRLFDDGLLVTGIRPPTVPSRTARLRLSITLAHRDSDLDRAAAAIAAAVRAAMPSAVS